MERGTPDDFRIQLQNELVRRCRNNPSYSLRSFARALEIDHSSLSQYLRGRRRLSMEMRQQVAARAGLLRGPEASEPDASGLPLDAFAVISDWYHYAIFELVTLRDFQPKPRWIARTLGITVNEVHIAVERLFRLGLLRRDAKGKWEQGAELISTTNSPFSSAAFRNLQTQLLQQALRAMEDTPIERRDQSSMTMAIPSSRLAEAKERIKKFRRGLCASLQAEGERDVVYHLCISFYPVTPVIPEGGK
jgi:transcriptional regulator with XRE-family HTH domain